MRRMAATLKVRPHQLLHRLLHPLAPVLTVVAPAERVPVVVRLLAWKFQLPDASMRPASDHVIAVSAVPLAVYWKRNGTPELPIVSWEAVSVVLYFQPEL
jgi:hypothetical protein